MSELLSVELSYSQLAKALKLCVPVAQKNKKDPHIMLCVNRSEVSIETTSGDALLCYRMEAEANFTGQLILPPRILRALQVEDGGNVVIAVGQTSTVIVTIHDDIWVFPSQDASEYPLVNWSTSVDGSVSAGELLEAIKFVEHAIDRDQSSTKYALTGIGLDIQWGSKIWVQATDSRRLAFTRVELIDESGNESKANTKRQAVIPAGNLPTLKALCQLDERVEVVEVGEQLQFKAGPLIMISKLMEGRFPNVRNTAVKDAPFAAVPSDQLQQAVQVAAVCVDIDTPGVDLAFRFAPTGANGEETEELPPTVSVQSGSALGKAKGVGWCLSVDQERQLTVKAEYVLEALKSLDENTRCELRANGHDTLQIDCPSGTIVIAGMTK